MAAVRVRLSEQKAQAAESFGAESQDPWAGNVLLRRMRPKSQSDGKNLGVQFTLRTAELHKATG